MKKRLHFVAALLALVLPLTACSDAGVRLDDPKTAATALPLGEELKLGTGDTTVAELGAFTMTVNDEFLNISVKDKRTGRCWSTNQPDPDMDSVALSDTVDLLKAHFQLNYYDTNGNWATMNSYTDCIANGQYTMYSVENGVAVRYSFGNLQRTLDDVPSKMTDSRFREKLLQHLSQEEQALLTEEYYRFYESENMWSLMKKGRNNYTDILEMMDKAGYTAQDLAEDNRMFGISVSSASRIGFVITVYYTLTERGLTVEIPTSLVEYSEDYPLYDIVFLPNFASQRLTEENRKGFLLVPDGSGALMRFDSLQPSSYYYEAPVYGRDEVVSLRSTGSSTGCEQVTLPVYGVSDGQSGVLAFISDGAANARITANRAGRNSEQFTVYPTFSFINMDYVTISGSTEASQATVFQRTPYEGSLKVEYFILNDGGSYVQMAASFRAYLEETGVLSPLTAAADTIPFYLETVGGASGPKDFLGIAYTGVVAATTYEQNITIVKDLQNRGVQNLKLRLLGWYNGGMYPDYPARIQLISSLGGSKGFDKLLAYCSEQGVGLYPDVRLLSGGDGNGFRKSRAARTLDSRYAQAVDRMSLALGEAAYSSWVYAPIWLQPLAESFLGSYSRFGLQTVSLGDNGRRLYADYNDTLERSYDRASTQRYVEMQNRTVSGTLSDVMLTTGNLYALSMASHIVDSAADHSWFLAEDEAVPFIQIVLHGSISLGSKPINLESDMRRLILRCAEYGMYPSFQLCYTPTTTLSETEFSENFSACYLDWCDTAAGAWKRLNDVLAGVQTRKITGHAALGETLFRTEYDNGTAVYVNYGDKEVTVDGVTVPPGDFRMKEGGR